MLGQKHPTAASSLRRAHRFILLLSLLGPLLAAGVMIGIHRVGLEELWRTLEGVALAQAGLVEAVGEFDARFSTDDVEGGSFAATLSQVIRGQAASGGFRETGRIWIGVKDGGVVRAYGDGSSPLPAGAALEPGSELHRHLGRALAGGAGRARFTGMEGQAVMAVFRPIHVPGGTLGILVQLDRREARGFVYLGALFAVLLGGGLVLLGWGVSVRVARPGLEGYDRLERRFRTLLEGAEIPLLYTSRDGLILEANPAAAAFVGLELEALLGRTLGDFLPDKALHQQLREEAWGRGRLEARTVRVRTEDGNDRWALVTAVTSTAGSQEVPAMQLLLQDVTHLKDTEEAASTCGHKYDNV